MKRLLIALLVWPVSASAEGPRPDADALARRAADQLVSALRARQESELRIEAVPVSVSQRLSRFGADAIVRLPSDLTLRNRMCAWVEQPGRRERVAVWFKVRAIKAVPVLARDLRARERVRDADIRVEERDIAGLRHPAVLPEAAVGKRVTRYLAAASILTTSDLEQLPAVLASQQVAVRVVTGSVVIETTGIAEEEGRRGDTIRVRNAAGDGVFHARVASEKKVEVITR